MSTEYFSEDRDAYLKLRKSASCAHKLDYHFVFATKYRRPVLVGGVAETLRTMLVSICEEKKWLLLGLSVQPEHVHILIGLKPDSSPNEVAHDLKGLTSYRLMALCPELAAAVRSTKLWGRGYSVETLGRSNVSQVNVYLQRQDAHHTESEIDRS